MISEIWLFLPNGIPLWNAQLDASGSKIDNSLISGLLTATSSFADEALGGKKLQDLLLENHLLHQQPALNFHARFAVLIDKRVDIDKVDKILKKCDDRLLDGLEKAHFDIEKLDTLGVDFQVIFQRVASKILEQFTEDLNVFREYLSQIYSDSFDKIQLMYLQRIPEIIPFLVKEQLSLSMYDIASKKVHFSHKDPGFSPRMYEQLDALIRKFVDLELLFNSAQLVTYISYFILGGLSIAMYAMHRNLFVMVGYNEPDKFNRYERLAKDVQKRIFEAIK